MKQDTVADVICVTAGGLTLEIDIADPVNGLPDSLSGVITEALRAANDLAGPTQGCLSVLIADDERLRHLNKVWRNFDKPTNVLSFPSPAGHSGPENHLGDIAISHETAAREAAAEQKTLDDHIAHLSVHGYLHLLGYDHVSDEEAANMERLERAILGRLGIPDPYIVYDAEG